MRPEKLEQFIGNHKAVNKVKHLTEVFLKTGKRVPHLGLFGPAGTGKTLLSELIAKTIDAHFAYMNATAINSPQAFHAWVHEAFIMTDENGAPLRDSNGIIRLYPRVVALIDECHALPQSVQNNLLSLLEYPFEITTAGPLSSPVTGELMAAKNETVTECIPEEMCAFSFLFATTHQGSMGDALLSRLVNIDIVDYSIEEKAIIANNILKNGGIQRTKEALIAIGTRARSAREVNRHCERIIEYSALHGIKKLTPEVVDKVYDLIIGIDENGLSEQELKLLNFLMNSGKASAASVAKFLSITQKQLTDKIEPHLIKLGLIKIESGGRSVTPKALEILKFKSSNKRILGGI